MSEFQELLQEEMEKPVNELDMYSFCYKKLCCNAFPVKRNGVAASFLIIKII